MVGDSSSADTKQTRPYESEWVANLRRPSLKLRNRDFNSLSRSTRPIPAWTPKVYRYILNSIPVARMLITLTGMLDPVPFPGKYMPGAERRWRWASWGEWTLSTHSCFLRGEQAAKTWWHRQTSDYRLQPIADPGMLNNPLRSFSIISLDEYKKFGVQGYNRVCLVRNELNGRVHDGEVFNTMTSKMQASTDIIHFEKGIHLLHLSLGSLVSSGSNLTYPNF